MSKASFLPQSSEFINFYARVKLEKFLKKVRKMIREQAKLHLQIDQKQIKTITQPQVFLSYAWEEKTLKNEALQNLLKAMKEDFESAGMRPWLDLAQMTGELDEKMRLGIQASQYVLLIGTNRYAARTKPDSNTNVYKELQFTLDEYKRRSGDSERADFLLPLMLEGDYSTTFPTLGHHLIRDGRSWYNLEQNNWQSIHDYIKRLTEYEPVGIVPCLLGLSRLNDYPAYRKACVDKYKDYQQLLMLELNLERGKIEKREFEESLKEHQEKLDKQAAEQENIEIAIKAQLTEIKKYSETPGELRLVSKSPIQQKSSINPWPETKFDSEWVRKAKGIVLEDMNMCPIVGRPLYDAVTLKHDTGKDHIVSDEAARDWLIVRKNSTCPCCQKTVIGVEIPRSWRSMVRHDIWTVLSLEANSSPLPGTKLKSSPPADTKSKESSPQTLPPVSPNNLNQLLQFVAEGEQEKAEKLIWKDPRLLLLSGEVKDLSGREFKQITAFQYALWAVDWHMWTMIQKYLSKENQGIQLRGLEIRSTAYGKHFTLTGLTNALELYVALIQHGHWILNRRAEPYWSQGVGREQKLLPAHVVNEYCHSDRAFDPCPKEWWKSQLPRTRETESMSWFTPLASGVELGSVYAFYRGNTKRVVHCRDSEWPFYDINPEYAPVTKGVIADLKALQSLWEVRTQQLKLLKSQFLSTPMQSALQDQLVTACKEGDEKQVRMLLDNGALPDMPNAKGEQPLGAAVWGMCPNIINALLTRVDGVAPMTWAECENHNRAYYNKVFVGTYERQDCSGWRILLENIESNKFLKSIHLEGACKHYQQQYSWENLKGKCAQLNQPYSWENLKRKCAQLIQPYANKKDEEFWEKTGQEFESLGKQIKQTLEEPPIPKISRLEQPGLDSKHTTKSTSPLPLPLLAETTLPRLMSSLPKTGSASPDGNDTGKSLNQNLFEVKSSAGGF